MQAENKVSTDFDNFTYRIRFLANDFSLIQVPCYAYKSSVLQFRSGHGPPWAAGAIE